MRAALARPLLRGSYRDEDVAAAAEAGYTDFVAEPVSDKIAREAKSTSKSAISRRFVKQTVYGVGSK